MKVLPAALQYGDSGYPAGAYAHSFGLEAAVEEGHVRSAAELRSAIEALIVHQTARTDAIGAAAAARAAASSDMHAYCAVDALLTAARPAREAREGSWRVGRQMLELAASCEGDAWLVELQRLIADGKSDGNHAAVCGAILGRLGASPEDAAVLTTWNVVSAVGIAAMRLGVITHVESQRMLTALRPLVAAGARDAASAAPPDLGGVAPMFEIWSMRHEVARGRLFAS